MLADVLIYTDNKGMIGRQSGEHTEFGRWSNSAGHALGSFVLANLPPEAVEAIDRRIITPSVNQLLRLAGIEVNGDTELTIDSLIGPTLIRDIPYDSQVLYFSGPEHPILKKARRLPTFVTYRDILSVNEDLGIRREDATVNFKGLVRGAFEDESITCYGEPREHDFEGGDVNGYHKLERYAVRREFARAAMCGEYRPGISGTHNANIFNGYGKSLIRTIIEQSGRSTRLDLTMHLESLEHIVSLEGSDDFFDWEATYYDADGLGYRVHTSKWERPILHYIEDLLKEIGLERDRPVQVWDGPTKEVFMTCVNALCPLDKSHKQGIKNGHACSQGVHFKGLTPKIVARAKTIAKILEGNHDTIPEEEDIINLDDPDLQNSAKQPVITPLSQHDW